MASDDGEGAEGSPSRGERASDAEGEPASGAAAPGASANRGADEGDGVATEDARSDRESDGVAAAERDDATAEHEEEPPPLLPEGNPLELARGSALTVAGALVAFVIMAIPGHFRFGVPIGLLGVLVASIGVLDLLGSFADPDERVARTTKLAELAGPLGLAAGGLLATLVVLDLSVAGYLNVTASAILVPAAFLTTVIGGYHVFERLGVFGDDTRPIWKRHGFWLVLIMTLLYLPMLGSHSLSDPWETHYGEVSREILSRDDWISTWWAQDGWFWSKPVLDFWIQALSMATLGVRYQPNRMLSAALEGHLPWPEWAVRMPVFVLSLLGVYLLYKAIAKVADRRAGLLGALVLATMPQWFLVTHQTMTDMPFVAMMSAAMALFLLGAHEDPDREVRAYEIDLGRSSIRVSAYHLVVGAVLACALPQILYLFSRNLTIHLSPFDLRVHMDSFMSGSAGNCGLPGNEACRPALPFLRGLSPSLQALIWLQMTGIFLFLNWGERRAQRLLYLAAWFFAAISTMAKGPAGVGLPVLCALAYVGVTRRWRDLLTMEITSGLLILVAIALPWYVAMYARHGQPFTDRLLFHDMFKRAFTHVHDTNEGDDTSFRYYVWQLGYAMFPWTGLVPTGLVWWLRRREDEDARSDASVFLTMWFLFAFALFALMLTKFHHYILPAVPAAAMLVGIFLSDAMGGRARRKAQVEAPSDASDDARAEPASGLDLARRAPFLAALSVLAFGVSLWLTWSGEHLAKGSALGVVVSLLRTGGVTAALMTIATVVTALAAWVLLEQRAPSLRKFRARYESLAIGGVAIAGSMLVALVGRDLFVNRPGQPSQIRLLHLFTYNYKRPWPPSLDFSTALAFFTFLAAALVLALAAARIRARVVAALVVVAALFTAWGIDVYFVKTSPHWGQRETILAYYRESQKVPGPIVAYQMNWKGENFYTGNAIPAFVSSGKRFQDYILAEKKKGKKTFYFVTEHGRTGSLSNELGAPRIFEKLTTPELNNKFVLVRAQFE